ncbi:MAG: hypothetical protein KAT77_03775 [Nanoarchaeota archaeon]|nr:hypothetical protein [Nanoarchaeota archaeon]
MIDLKQKLLPVKLLDWIRLYDLPSKNNYAVEFLSAATDRSIEILNAEKYQIPSGIPKKDLFETIEKTSDGDKERIRSRKKGTIKNWRNGIRPWAIKTMDDLRGHGNTDFEIDLFNTELYDGTSFSGSQIPYAVESLPGIAYLFGSVLFSGHSTNSNKRTKRALHRNQAVIHPSVRLPKESLEHKLKGIVTPDMTEGVCLKQGYANVLGLMGLPLGKKSKNLYHELGLGFIENLSSWLRTDELDEAGKKHAENALNRFVESLVDPRYLSSERPEIYLPGFRDEETAGRFKDLIVDVWNLVNPDVGLRTWKQKNSGSWYHHLGLKAEDVNKLEKRFPVYRLNL